MLMCLLGTEKNTIDKQSTIEKEITHKNTEKYMIRQTRLRPRKMKTFAYVYDQQTVSW